ncbi:isoleucine--tRNA ligase [Striga asiatica]|uniref:Isoleucine--tRNA ligase n=1 Tax=Striga asiatica TaxID=4170 RepID=A0A5A7QXZ0_STRAF|nr:isoleucine--tRNA ligase [Striga asiatica]
MHGELSHNGIPVKYGQGIDIHGSELEYWRLENNYQKANPTPKDMNKIDDAEEMAWPSLKARLPQVPMDPGIFFIAQFAVNQGLLLFFPLEVAMVFKKLDVSTLLSIQSSRSREPLHKFPFKVILADMQSYGGK